MIVKELQGVGKDAEVVTNDNGGKQSKAISSLHLIDPDFLYDWYNNPEVMMGDNVISSISGFMKTGFRRCLIDAVFELHNIIHTCHEDNALIVIGKVLQEGAEKYKVNNWRLIPQEEHINHALIHYVAYLMGDEQDDHIEHCMCRLMMAYATSPSKDFSYTTFIA